MLYNPQVPLFSLHIPKTAGISLEKVLRSWFDEYPFPNLNNHPRLYKLLTPLNFDFFLKRVLGSGLYLHYSNEKLAQKPRVVPLGRKYGMLNRHHMPECVHGHFEPNADGGNLFDLYPNASQFITFLRDPLEMQLSLFFYLKKMIEDGNMYWRGEKMTRMEYDGDIDRWIEERGSYMLLFLPMQFDSTNYKEVLEKYFVHIGVTDDMQKSVDVLANKMSFKSVKVPLENATIRDIWPSETSIRKFKEKHDLEYRIYDYALSLNK